MPKVGCANQAELLDWLLREGTRAIVVLGSINLPAAPAQVASEIAALPPIEPIARPAVHAFFRPNRGFVGSEPVEFPSRDSAASDARADAGGLSVLSGIHASLTPFEPERRLMTCSLG